MWRTTLWIFTFSACGEPLEPTAGCVAYVACVRARDAELGITTDMVRFEDGGACWDNPEISGLCDRGCTSGLAWLQSSTPGLPATCAP